MKRYIFSLLLGLITGILGGFFGISGAFMILPALIFLKLVPDQKTAAGTTLFILLPPISFFAVYHYWIKGKVDWKIGIPIILTYIMGAFIGSKEAINMDEYTLSLLLTILFIVLTVYSIYRTYHLKKN